MPDILDAAQAKSDTPVVPPPLNDNPIMVPAITPSVPEDNAVIPETTPPPPDPTPPAKKVNKGIVMTIILLLLVTLPLMVFYVSQQRQIAETRSNAKNDIGPEGPYKPDQPIPKAGVCTDGQSNECNEGDTLNVCNNGEWVGTDVPCGKSDPTNFCSGKQNECNDGKTLNICSNGEWFNSKLSCGIEASPTTMPSTPAPNKELGDPCNSSKECKSGVCKRDETNAHVCSPASTSKPLPPVTGTPPPVPSPKPTPGNSETGQCVAGNGFKHQYNEQCGPTAIRYVERSCVNGQFVWSTSEVGGQGSCTCKDDGFVWIDGRCNDIRGCTPKCTKDSICGSNDSCSGVCTENCKTQGLANEASNKGPGKGLVNKGKGILCDEKGVCKSGDGELWLCLCDNLLTTGSHVGYCDKCSKISATSADCLGIANAQCKAVQLDVYDKSGGLVDVTSCSPTVSCSSSNPPPGGSGDTGGGGNGGGGGGGGTTPGTTPPPPQCVSIKIYKNGTVVTPSTLSVGDAVKIAVTKNTSSKARVRINGGAWSETTTLNNNNEYTVDWTVPSGLTSFTVESQIYVNGAWL